jgi:chloramphenicol O-acetyltransferase type A
MIKKNIDLENWNRKEHFNFFLGYDEPFFGIVTNIECSKAYKYCKQNNISFFLYYFYNSLKAVNEIDEMRYRIENNQPVEYNKIHASQTIERDDNTFAFGFFPYTNTLEEFLDYSEKEIIEIKKTKGLGLERVDNPLRADVIHYSTITWFSFKGLTHARNFQFKDSIPKITFGKFFKEKNNLYLPLSLNAHHSLMDGYHVGKYLNRFEELLNG